VVEKKQWGRVLALCAVIIMIGIMLVSFMVRDADAGMSFMMFKVVFVGDEIITVEDEYGSMFSFYKVDTPNVEVGEEVVVCTDIKYLGGDMWKWDRSRTSIIAAKDKSINR
jgi:hypothetical protein